MQESCDVVYKIPGDGLCAINAAAAHMYEDEVFGPSLRMEMNKHILKYSSYYENKGYCASEKVPFERKIGGGQIVKFNSNISLFDWLKNSKDSVFMWSDSEDLLVLCNMFQFKICVLTTFSGPSRLPSKHWIHPDPDMADKALMTPGQVPDIRLLHANDSHFNLIVSKESRLEKDGSVSHRTKRQVILEKQS